MRWPALATFDREAADDPRAPVLYGRSYLGIRLAIGVVALLLPVALVLLDWLVMTEGRQVRGSMSAYYHSPARDLFVGALCLVGGLLLTYLLAQPWTWDFLLSTVCGLAVIGVAFFPSARPGWHRGDPDCAAPVLPPGRRLSPDDLCTGLQQHIGEARSNLVHGSCSAVVVLMLIGLCVAFARREATLRRHPRPVRVRLYVASAVVVFVGGLWATTGPVLHLGGYAWGRVYVGEVISFACFSCAWLTASVDLLAELGRRLNPFR